MALPGRDECLAALRGFVAVLRGDPQAPRHYDLSVDGVWRSFWPGLLLTIPYTLLLPAADPTVTTDVGALLGQFVLQLAVRSEEHTSELQSLMRISYAVFCLKKKKDNTSQKYTR